MMQHADALSRTPVVSIRISTLSWTEFEETQNLSEDILLVRRWVLNSLRPDTKLKDASPTLKALCNVSEFWSLKGMFFVENMKYRLLYQVCLICNFERYPRFVEELCKSCAICTGNKIVPRPRSPMKPIEIVMCHFTWLK